MIKPLPEKLLFWFDCEMTGLDVHQDSLLEVGLKVSNPSASFIIDGPSYVIHSKLQKLQAMNKWCVATHQANNLWSESISSTITVEHAEENLINFIKTLPPQDVRYMAGSSIWCDRIFLQKYMPNLIKMFHYRLIDVSSLKIIFQLHVDKPYAAIKSDKHRVMDDIDASIQEYRYYLQHMTDANLSSC